MNINTHLVQQLISAQFPQWAELPITPVEVSGWDNRTFRLGDEMLVRLPSNQCYEAQVIKEQQWLPKLARHLSIPIPAPLAMGQPSDLYPWHWSVYGWLEGKSANQIKLTQTQLTGVATQLALFINQLHAIDTTDGPTPGLHNYHRGAHFLTYAADGRKYVQDLKNVVNADKAIALLDQAAASSWQHKPVWVHGDIVSGNILIGPDGQLAAVIDFGCMAVGDPACDLTAAWTIFNGKSRHIFKSLLAFDDATWQRARAWALWKALAILVHNGPEQEKHTAIIAAVLED